MKSNSVCNHTSDKQNRTTAERESDLFNHELPINHNFNKICDIIGYFLNQNIRNSKFCFASSEKKAI